MRAKIGYPLDIAKHLEVVVVKKPYGPCDIKKTLEEEADERLYRLEGSTASL